MAVRHGYGKIAGADALVFAYDTGDTRNSYKGEPTENLLNDTTEFDSWTKARNSGTTPTVTSNTSPNPLGIPNAPMADTLVIPDDGTYPRIQQYFTPTSTNQHTMSVWIRSLSGDCDCFLGIFRNSPWSLPGHTVVSVTSEWQRFSFTMTPPDTTTHVAYIGSHDAAAQKGNTLELWGAMIEENSHKTPFTAGTRSATQGLLDLTGNSTIDLSNVSFDSNAQMTFDGTDDWLNIPVALNAGNFTYETVMQASNASYQIFSAGTGVPSSGGTTIQAFVNSSGALINLYAPVGGSGWQYGSYNNQSAYVGVSGAIRHITVVNLNTNWKTYVNGVLVGDVNFFVPNTGNAIGVARAAMQNISTVSTTVYMSKVYNRALTAQEVRNNYNQYKGRFNI